MAAQVPILPTNLEDATHVVQRMIERQISWTDVLAVIANPSKTVPGHSGRMNHYAVVGGRRLRVTIDASNVLWTVAIAGRTA